MEEEEGEALQPAIYGSINEQPCRKRPRPIERPSSWWALAWDTIQEKRLERLPEQVEVQVSHRNQWLALLFGQVIALLASSMNAASFTLNYHFGVRTFLFQMIWVYLILSVHMFTRSSNGNERSRYRLPGTNAYLQIPWWMYLGISILDVLPNFLTLLSFSYTSLTSTTLLGSLAVPSTMFFSRQILGKVFHVHHVAGVALCIVGGILTVWTDLGDGAQSGGTRSEHSYIGDIFAVIASLMYGLGDTVAEFSIKHLDRQEYLGMIGVFGCLLSVLVVPILEGDAVQQMFESSNRGWVACIMCWYVLSVVLYYICEAKFLVRSDATLLNLSMQATNIYAIVFAMIAYGEHPSGIFYAAVFLVVAGAFCYELGSNCSGQVKNIIQMIN